MASMVSKAMGSNENNAGGSNIAHIQDLSCQSLEVSFGCLETLSTNWNPFRDHKIDISFFSGSTKFGIVGYEGSTSFITSSIVEKLVNLTILVIRDCDEMELVIANDEKKGMSGGQSTLLQFPKLQELILSSSPKLVNFCEWKCDVELPSLRKVKIGGCTNIKNLTMGSLNAPNLESFETDMLELNGLSKLVNFCEWKCDIELPSLREVEILCCENMKRFTLGHLGTLNLQSVCIDHQAFDPLQDLNGLLQQVFEERKQKEDNEEEGGGAGLERMGEIVEEQN